MEAFPVIREIHDLAGTGDRAIDHSGGWPAKAPSDDRKLPCDDSFDDVARLSGLAHGPAERRLGRSRSVDADDDFAC